MRTAPNRSAASLLSRSAAATEPVQTLERKRRCQCCLASLLHDSCERAAIYTKRCATCALVHCGAEAAAMPLWKPRAHETCQRQNIMLISAVKAVYVLQKGRSNRCRTPLH